MLDDLEVWTPGVFYHGTAEHVYEAVAKDGLHPNKKEVEHDGFTDEQVADYKEQVFITKSVSEASTYADIAGEDNMAKPMVLRITVPKGSRVALSRDPELKSLTAWRYKGKIPKDWIEHVPHLPEKTRSDDE